MSMHPINSQDVLAADPSLSSLPCWKGELAKRSVGFFHAKGNWKVTSSSANVASSCGLPPFYAGAVDTTKTKDDASVCNWCMYLKSQLPYLVTIPVYFIIAHLLFFCISLKLAIANLNKTFILLVCTKFFRMPSIIKCWCVQTGNSAEDAFIWKERGKYIKKLLSFPWEHVPSLNELVLFWMIP